MLTTPPARPTSRPPRRARSRRADAPPTRRRRPRCRRRAPARRAPTRPSSAGSSGAITATTPVGSGSVKLKYGPATGFDEPSTCASLSAQPAYQTTRSIGARDLAPTAADRRERPDPRLHRLGEPVEHLAAVVGGRRAPRRERPCAPRRPRRGRPCATPGRRCGPPARASARTRSAGTRRRCRACTSCGRGVGSSRSVAHSNLRYASRPCRPPSRPKPDSL